MDSKDWTSWEGNPKNGFDRRRLERCWNLPNTEEKVEDRGVTDRDTTYRNKGVGQKDMVNVETPVERIKRKEKQMGYKGRPHREPYWNFWRAVFAGWLIRYPGKIFKGIGMFFLFIVFMVFMAVSPEVEETPSTRYNQEVIQ